MINGISKVAATLVLAAGLAFPAASFAQVATNPGVSLPAHAKTAAPARHARIDCEQVMSELGSGKKPKEVAESMKISVSSVYRCRKKEKLAEANKEKKAGGTAAPAPAAASTKTK
jgi:DNA-binding NarL/FixJ family response regulator